MQATQVDERYVIFWTNFFMDRAKEKNVFSNFQATLAHAEDKLDVANSVASAWYSFTCFVPTFLSKDFWGITFPFDSTPWMCFPPSLSDGLEKM